MVLEVESMLGRVLMLISSPDKKLGKVADAISLSEETVDFLEKEITEYLVSVSQLETSDEQSHELAGILGAVGDVERIGDHCESLLRLTARRYDKNLTFSEQGLKELNEIGELTAGFIALLLENLIETTPDLMSRARLLEDKINKMRHRMRKNQVARLTDGTTDASTGLLFIDMLTSFEKIGDHSFNVAQMLAGER